MSRLTTHILDTSHGAPAHGVSISVFKVDEGVEGGRSQMASAITNDDGRCDSPLLEGDDFVSGVYELEFEIGAYFRARGVVLSDPPFLDNVVLRVGISNADQHYHVPLLVSPFGYSTYRGS